MYRQRTKDTKDQNIRLQIWKDFVWSTWRWNGWIHQEIIRNPCFFNISGFDVTPGIKLLFETTPWLFPRCTQSTCNPKPKAFQWPSGLWFSLQWWGSKSQLQKQLLHSVPPTYQNRGMRNHETKSIHSGVAMLSVQSGIKMAILWEQLATVLHCLISCNILVCALSLGRYAQREVGP